MIATETTQAEASTFSSDEARWDAVCSRDESADGVFYYCVATTGIYCRPSCPAKRASRRYVSFVETRAAAEAAGFRPCKRCRPEDQGLRARHAELIRRACRLLEEDPARPLEALATAVGVSAYHLHRLFKLHTGVTPRRYGAILRRSRLQRSLPESRTVTAAMYDAGFNSSSAFYEASQDLLGMRPGTARAAGRGEVIRYAVVSCWLGSALIAATDVGVCAIFLGADADELVPQLERRFKNASLMEGDESFLHRVAAVVEALEDPARGNLLPLDIRGTAFQQRVWEALRCIPAGETASYTEIAARIGDPKSVRAVAQACGANPLAVVIPCHRVVRRDGGISGYRWGVERKKKLLSRERAQCVGADLLTEDDTA